MSKPKEISATMAIALDMAHEHGGKLIVAELVNLGGGNEADSHSAASPQAGDTGHPGPGRT